jgi:hypothetical protein
MAVMMGERFESRFLVVKPEGPEMNHGSGFAAAALVTVTPRAARERMNFIL